MDLFYYKANRNLLGFHQEFGKNKRKTTHGYACSDGGGERKTVGAL